MRTITIAITGLAALSLVVMGSISPAAAAHNGPITLRALPGLQQAAWGGCSPRCEQDRRAGHERERFVQHRRWEEHHRWRDSHRSVSPPYRYGEHY
jgi:hypothetical protein